MRSKVRLTRRGESVVSGLLIGAAFVFGARYDTFLQWVAWIQYWVSLAVARVLNEFAHDAFFVIMAAFAMAFIVGGLRNPRGKNK